MIVNIILIAVAVYLAAGLIFAIPFVIKGVSKVDEGAHGGSLGFRIIIIPGTMLFWPFLLKRWMKALKQKVND
ncbi:MAG: hypothetical protein AAB221_07240 [Bacteroidota bacterium]